jgi:hypothetical protein
MRQMAAQAKSTLDIAMLPFPAEPVGVGAQWRRESRAESAGVAVALTSTYELVERSKASVRVKRTVVAKADPGVITLPGSATKVEIRKCDGSGVGDLRQALDQVMPASWTYNLKIRMSLRAEGQDLEQTVSVDASGGDKLLKK